VAPADAHITSATAPLPRPAENADTRRCGREGHSATLDAGRIVPCRGRDKKKAHAAVTTWASLDSHYQ